MGAEELNAGLARVSDALPGLLLSSTDVDGSAGALDSDGPASPSDGHDGAMSLAASPHAALELLLVMMDDPSQRRLRHRTCRQVLACGMFELLFAVGSSRWVGGSQRARVHRRGVSRLTC